MLSSPQLPYELASDDELRALLGGPDPRLFEVARTGDVAGLRQLLKVGAGLLLLIVAHGVMMAPSQNLAMQANTRPSKPGL